ncbi:MAG TPA: SOS response-associated peptidase [Steroidobacteraceae bacterium]
MCERIVIPGREQVEEEIPVSHRWWTFTTRFNVAAGQSVPAVRLHEKQSEGIMLRWGLVPASHQGEDVPPGDACVSRNTLETSAAYRTIWTHGQRCIIPLAGFYVWQRTAAGHRQPFYVRLVNRPVFGIAAVWDRFVTDGDDVIEGCALISVRANSLLTEVTNTHGRMPAILQREGYQTWLSGRPAQAKELLRPFAAERMLLHAVGPHVNFPQYDDASLIRPIRGD